jgi:alanine dehydrogenase
MKTLIITKEDVQKVLTPALAIKTVQRAFRAYGSGQADMPAKSYLHFKKGDLRSMPAYLNGQGFNVAGIKSVNVHPGNGRHELPAVMAVIVLTDPKNGFPLAVMDGTYLTGMRTGAAGGLAAKLLSRKNAEVAGFVGCGMQARTQLACTMEVRKLKAIKVWQRSRRTHSARSFCKWAEEVCGVDALFSADIDDVTTHVDILITTTPSRKPLVNNVSAGTHINAFGADAEGKQEISPQILKQSKLVVDDWAQAAHSGEINMPLRKRQIFKKHIYGELADIALGKKQGRTSETENTLFDSTGLAIQDISCASAVYKALKDQPDIRRVSLF